MTGFLAVANRSFSILQYNQAFGGVYEKLGFFNIQFGFPAPVDGGWANRWKNKGWSNAFDCTRRLGRVEWNEKNVRVRPIEFVVVCPLPDMLDAVINRGFGMELSIELSVVSLNTRKSRCFQWGFWVFSGGTLLGAVVG